ncbi:MAG TPA: tetratricopeptide repeat protein [Thermohalobaculum sp.]|nr:tetratricopeptide repeat protein [Thermohalobaculum sp.]
MSAGVIEAFKGALALHQSGKTGEARSAYRELLDQAPSHAEALNNLAALEINAGRSAEALELLFRAVQARPRFGECYHNIGQAMMNLGRPGEAVGYLQNAVRFYNKAIVHTDLARAWANIGQAAEAVAAARKALSLDPEDSRALTVLAVQSFGLQDDQTAGETFETLARDHGGGSEAWFNAMKCWRRARDWPRAEAALEAAAAAGAESGLLLRNRATFAHDHGRLDEALDWAERAVQLDSDNPGSHEVRGLVLHDLGRFDEAIREYDTVIARWPQRRRAEVFKALSLLLQGRFQEGFETFEARWFADFPPPMFQRHGYPHIPHWQGEPLKGKRLFLIAEQGFGDAIQFVRYAKDIRESGASITLYCKARLMPMFGDLGWFDRFIETGSDEIPEVDFQAPLLSLPRILGRYPPDVPLAEGYIPAPGTDWDPGPGPTVGLVWRGNPQNAKDWKRSLRLAPLEPLLEVPGINWVSLQLEPENREIAGTAWEGRLADVSAHMQGWRETAAVIGKLDLVISVDTAQVHLAGALGKPAWLLLSEVPDWRWGLEGDTTPWYESLRLYRAAGRGVWQPVIDRMADDLRAWAAGR